MNVHCSSIHNSQKRGKQPKHLSTQLINRQHVVYQYNGMLFIQVASLVLLGFTCSSVSKESACNVGGLGSIPGSGRSPRKGNATHSSILAWRIPQTEDPGRLQSMGSQESDTTKHSTVLLRFCALHRTSYLARGGNSLIGLSQSDSTLKFGG